MAGCSPRDSSRRGKEACASWWTTGPLATPSRSIPSPSRLISKPATLARATTSACSWPSQATRWSLEHPMRTAARLASTARPMRLPPTQERRMFLCVTARCGPSRLISRRPTPERMMSSVGRWRFQVTRSSSGRGKKIVPQRGSIVYRMRPPPIQGRPTFLCVTARCGPSRLISRRRIPERVITLASP